MTNDIKIKTPPVPSKEEIIEKVIDIFIDTIEWIDRNEVTKSTKILEDFKIYHDDISLFLRWVFEYFYLPYIYRVECAPTIEGISEYVFNYLSSGKPLEDPRDRKGRWDKFMNWVKSKIGIDEATQYSERITPMSLS
jgi:hypothetical protein